MTIKELDKILELKDFDKIRAKLESRGFRHVNEIGTPEFELGIIYLSSNHVESSTQADKEGRLQYRGIILKDCNDYEGITFIEIVILMSFSQAYPKYLPTNAAMFTDAPINEEYERALNSPYLCESCGKECIKKAMSDFDNKLLCDDCFNKAVQKMLTGSEEFTIL